MKDILSIIIVNYKNEDLTINYVKNEISKITIPYRVVIINNEATIYSDNRICDELDGNLVKDIQSFDCSEKQRVFVLHSDDNLGFAKANNLGVFFAKKNFDSKYYLFSNNDIVFNSSSVVEKLIEKLSSIDSAAIIGPKIVGLDGILQSPEPDYPFWNRMVLLYFSKLFYSKDKRIKKFYLDYSNNAKEGFHYKVMGSFFICKAKDYEECGGMDPNTFLFYEENILSERLSAIGKGVYYYPDVLVTHAQSSTIRKYASNKRFRDLCFESASYFYSKYKRIPSWALTISKFFNELAKLFGK